MFALIPLYILHHDTEVLMSKMNSQTEGSVCPEKEALKEDVERQKILK